MPLIIVLLSVFFVAALLALRASVNALRRESAEQAARITDLEDAVVDDDDVPPALDALPDLSVDVTSDVDDEQTQPSAEPISHRDRKLEV